MTPEDHEKMVRMAELVQARRDGVISEKRYLKCLSTEKFRWCGEPCAQCART